MCFCFVLMPGAGFCFSSLWVEVFGTFTTMPEVWMMGDGEWWWFFLNVGWFFHPSNKRGWEEKIEFSNLLALSSIWNFQFKNYTRLPSKMDRITWITFLQWADGANNLYARALRKRLREVMEMESWPLFGRDIISFVNGPPKMLQDCILVTAGTVSNFYVSFAIMYPLWNENST